MESDHNEWIILSDLELNLCIRLLGQLYWNDYPATADEQGAEQQILNAFLHLVNTGLMESAGKNFSCTNQMKTMFRPVLQVMFRWEILSQDKLCFTIYESNEQCTVIKTIHSQPSWCGIRAIPYNSFPEILSSFFLEAADDPFRSETENVIETAADPEDGSRLHDVCVTVICVTNGIRRSAEIVTRRSQFFWNKEDALSEIDLPSLINYLRGETNRDYHQRSLYGAQSEL